MYVDRLSGWLKVGYFAHDATSTAVKRMLLSFFKRWGAPKEISSDGGIKLVSEDMRELYRKWGITIIISSAHYPQSNGRAEGVVNAAKRVLRGNVETNGQLSTSKVRQALL